MRSKKRAPRGNAIVEFAVAMIVVLPSVIYVVYSGELLVGSLKAQEAEMNSGWDISAQILHDYRDTIPDLTRGDLPRYGQAISRATQSVANQLGDFDSYPGSANSSTKAFTRAQFNSAPSCEPIRNMPTGLLTFVNNNALPSKRPNDDSCRNAAGDPMECPGIRDFVNVNGYVRCQANLTMTSTSSPIEIPLLGNVIDSAWSNLSMCGFSDSTFDCRQGGGFTLMTDDWALSAITPMGVVSNVAAARAAGSGNEQFYNLAEGAYFAHGNARGSQEAIESFEFFTDGFIGTMPSKKLDHADIDRFKFGYQPPGSKISIPVAIPNGAAATTMMDGYLTPTHDEEQPYFDETFSVYQSRTNRYLGKDEGYRGN